jgi:tyrosine aminotransferase
LLSNNLFSIYGSLQQVEAGAKRLAQVILGASHLAQSAVPALLQETPEILAWKADLRRTLEQQARFLSEQLASVPGLRLNEAAGAMYNMVYIDTEKLDIDDDVEFSKALLEEENVFVLPGSCFGVGNMFRVVFCAPLPVLEEASLRIREFCQRHTSKI